MDKGIKLISDFNLQSNKRLVKQLFSCSLRKFYFILEKYRYIHNLKGVQIVSDKGIGKAASMKFTPVITL